MRYWLSMNPLVCAEPITYPKDAEQPAAAARPLPLRVAGAVKRRLAGLLRKSA